MQFIGTVKQALELLNQNRTEHRLQCAALEALHFHHPYKNFTVEMALRDNVTPPTLTHDKVHVQDFTVEVARFGLYVPEGDTRDKTQLEIRYNYRVHDKKPNNIKRTSNLNKIDSLVKMVKPASSMDVLRDTFDASNFIDKQTKFSAVRREFRKVFERFYYGDKDANAQLIDDLLNKRDTTAVEQLRSVFEEARSKMNSAQDEMKALSSHIVCAVKNSHSGQYRIIRYNLAGDEQQKIVISDTIYNTKEELPKDVFGPIAVLEIGLHDNKYLEVEGIGEANTSRLGEHYLLVGKEFDGNAGTEGESQSI
jgi:hypothetical protein